MATYTEISIPFKSGTVNIEFNGVSLCDFHLIAKQVEDYIATRVSESAAPGPMVPLGSEERSPISMTSWHTPTLGELEAPFEEEPVIDPTKACDPDDEESTPVITKKPEKPESASQYFLLNKAISRMLERRVETLNHPSPPCYDGSDGRVSYNSLTDTQDDY